MERNSRRSTRLNASAKRLLSLALLCTASIWWFAAAVARADASPVNDGNLPSISGTAQQGDVLTADPGGWSGDPTINFSYAWSDGQSGNPITLSAADVGQSLTVTVTATNGAGSAQATSAGTATVLPAAPTPTPGDPPVIAGTAQQGDTLSVSNGGWDNDPTGFNYAWEDCDSSGNNCAAITGASSSTYTLQASDVGSTIVASVTATNAGGPGSATSAATTSVLPAAPTPAAGNPPQITGTAQQGHTLSVSNGGWNNGPTGFTYAWEDCDGSGSNCTAIQGATSNSYALQASDVGKTIVAQVTASNGGGQNPATSAPTAVVLPAIPQVGTAPGISGSPQQGKTLTVSSGKWSNNPTKFTYAWQDCDSSGNNCSSVGTNSNTYALHANDVSHYVSVTVTASNSGGSSAPVTTAPVGPVLPPAPANTQAPTIAPSGATLTVSNGTWSNASTYSYVWESCDASGNNCVPISGATSSSYSLSAADIGSTIVCVVTATGPGGSASMSTGKSALVGTAQLAPGSQPTTTDLLTTPSAAVTNQGVTLIATVTAGTSSTALWGTVTFENGGAAIPGCTNMPAVPSGRSATVACSTSFAASSPRLSAVFTPSAGSILEASNSPGTGLAVGPDLSSTTLTAASSVNVGSSTTYTATVAPPASRPGPVQPTGSVEFLDGSSPIGSCASQPLANGAASCTVTYAGAGAHQITARYSGDANFTGSSSSTVQVSALSLPTPVLGTITATMQWAFYFTPRYTVVRNLVVNGASPGAQVVVRCQGRGCPFGNRATVLTKGKRCARKAKRACIAPGTLNLTSSFAGRHLRVGTRITITIIRAHWVGKSYRFTVRARRGPRVQISALPAS